MPANFFACFILHVGAHRVLLFDSRFRYPGIPGIGGMGAGGVGSGGIGPGPGGLGVGGVGPGGSGPGPGSGEIRKSCSPHSPLIVVPIQDPMPISAASYYLRFSFPRLCSLRAHAVH